MAQVHNEQVRVSTLSPYTGIKAILPGHSARPAIPLYEPCFVSKTPGFSLETVQLVSAVRGEERAMEQFLRDCNIVEVSFRLNAPSNLIPLDRTLSYTLNQLGFVAITCSKASLEAMLELVKAENAKYDQYKGLYNRVFNRLLAPVSNVEYEMVVLHPDHFLPTGSCITMHTQDPNDASRVSAKAYTIGEDGALREGRESTSQRFAAFSGSYMREDIHKVNPLLVVLNADMAFQRFRGLGDDITQRLCPEYAELVDLTIQLVDALYHPPVEKAAREIYFQRFPGRTEGNASEDVGFGTSRGGSNKKKVTVSKRSRGSAEAAARKRRAMKYSRFGKEVRDPGPNATDEEIRDFCYSILSGRDNPLTSHDEAVLKSIGLYYDEDDNEGDQGNGAEDEDGDYGGPKGESV